MKQLLLIFCLSLAFLNIGYSQIQIDPDFEVDTLTNADTLTFTVDTAIRLAGTATWHVVADSLSGDGTVNAFIQVAYDGSPVDWYEQDTIVIDGPTTNAISSFNITGLRTRLLVISSGTHTTRVMPYFVFKAGR